MQTETWIVFFGLVSANLFAMVGGVIKISNRLTKIETDLKWVIRNCNRCQLNSEKPTK